MKKLVYTMALLLTAASGTAQQSLWDPINGEKAAKFESWIDIKDANGNVVNMRPFGWYTSSSGAGAASVYEMRPTTDRNGVPNAACRADIQGIAITWGTWYTQTRILHGASADGDQNPLWIDKGTDFYYTFWAKADEDGMMMHIGPEELWNPSSYTPNDPNAWGRMPFVALTTKWTKHGVLITSRECFRDLQYFNIHWRRNGVRYFDDIELKTGTELPADVGSVIEGSGIFEYATDNKPVTVIAAKNGIAFTSMGGTISVYGVSGQQVAQKTVGEGINYIRLDTKGLHLLKYTADGKATIVKVIVK
jgi:hypothetical protein